MCTHVGVGKCVGGCGYVRAHVGGCEYVRVCVCECCIDGSIIAVCEYKIETAPMNVCWSEEIDFHACNNRV